MTQKSYIGLTWFLGWLVISVTRTNAAAAGLAEPAEAMQVWRATNGLPSDSVTAILQTHDCYLWVGTEAGLARFDGVKFTGLPLSPQATNNPVHVTSLCEDSHGYLWIGTQQNGLYELVEGQIRHYTKVKALLDNDVTSLSADDKGGVWIGTKAGLNFWDGNNFKSFTVQDGLPDSYVSGVNVARSGTVWITTHVGMCRFINGRIAPFEFQTESQGRHPEYLGAYEDEHGNLWAFGDTYLINLAEGKRFNYFRSSESASVRIWSLCEGWDGRLWIGTSGRGLYCFEDNRFQPVIFDQDRWPYDVRALCEDFEGNLWLGTSGGGLIQLHPQSVYALRAGQGLPDGQPSALAADANGKIYVGFQHGGLYVGQSACFDAIQNSDKSCVENYISCICVTRNGTLWAGTLGSGLYGLRAGRAIHLTTADGLADDAVSALCSDPNGGIWFSAGIGNLYHFIGNDLVHFDATQGLPPSTVTAIAPSTSGGLWVGTQAGQLLHEADGQFTNVTLAENFGHNPVLSLCKGESGQLWIGTQGGGLIFLSGMAAFNWNSSSGLPGDTVCGMVEDDGSNLWLATEEGVYRVSHDDLQKSLGSPAVPLACELMSKAGTILDRTAISCGTRAVLSPDGELWFATSEGVLSVDPHSSGILRHAFPIYIETAIFNGKPISLLKGALWSPPATNSVPFKAPFNTHSLEFHFTALGFSTPEEIQLRYKLEGNDSDWVDDAGKRSVRYGRLPYGHYRFRVQACDANGKWQEASEPFDFVVPTPLYFQTWILYVYGLTTVVIIVGIVRVVSHRRLRGTLVRLEQQQALERERMRIARDMHDEIGSKLTKISFLSEHAQVEANANGPLAKKIDSIAETSRELLKTMDEIVWVVNPRNDTLENLSSYLTHYAIEYFQNTPIECELRLPGEIPNSPLSSETRHNLFLAFEETLNNVLKHSGAAKVRIEMAATEQEFELKVVDDGKGFDRLATSARVAPVRGSGGGNGLINMNQRLAASGGECVIAKNSDRGTTVILRIPINARKPV